jgi:hypothetical protein
MAWNQNKDTEDLTEDELDMLVTMFSSHDKTDFELARSILEQHIGVGWEELEIIRKKILRPALRKMSANSNNDGYKRGGWMHRLFNELVELQWGRTTVESIKVRYFKYDI